jgi:hypothetical protein
MIPSRAFTTIKGAWPPLEWNAVNPLKMIPSRAFTTIKGLTFTAAPET